MSLLKLESLSTFHSEMKSYNHFMIIDSDPLPTLHHTVAILLDQSDDVNDSDYLYLLRVHSYYPRHFLVFSWHDLHMCRHFSGLVKCYQLKQTKLHIKADANLFLIILSR